MAGQSQIGLLVLIAVVIGFMVKKLWTDFMNPYLQSLSFEKLMLQQGVPVVPGRSIQHGHNAMEKWVKETLPRSKAGSYETASRLTPFEVHCARKYGNSFVLWWNTKSVLSTSDPDIVRTVLVSSFQDFPKGVIANRFQSLFGVNGILAVNGDVWAHQRKLISPAFRIEKLKGMADLMLHTIDNIVGKWKTLIDNGGGTVELDIVPYMGFLAMDVLSRTAFGTTYQKGKRYFELLIELVKCLMSGGHFHNTINDIPGIRWLPTRHNRTINNLEKKMCSVLNEVLVQSRLSKVKIEGSYGNDLLGLMLEALENVEGHKSMNTSEVVDNLRIFFIAGQETTATLLSWTIMLLGHHLDWQERAFQEVEDCIGSQPLDFDLVGKLKVMDMILQEVLRLYPAAIRLRRESKRDVKVGDLLIPKGMNVQLNVALLHTDPSLWGSDAELFNPERFANGLGCAAKHPNAYIPFSTGPRVCVGQGFAWLEAKLMMATILRTFKFHLSPKYVHEPTHVLTPQPRHGVPIILSRR